MNVLIAGGGTGGHLFPGIAVAEELKRRGHTVTFVGTERGIEARACPKEGWPLELITVSGLKRTGLLGLLRGLLRLPGSYLQSRRILGRHAPDVVVGVGGYASGPVLLAAALGGRPTAILEQNSVPGMTNRLLGRFVRAVFGSFAGAADYFPRQKYHLVGNPVRARVRGRLAAVEAAAGRGLLVVGGSQGAHAVNELVAEAMILLKARGKAPPLLHQSGEADRETLARRYVEAGIAAEVQPFIDDMAAAYAGAALVVARAGASTLAELTILGLPAILVPFPFAADDHQTKNARELEAAGAAEVVPQAGASAERLAARIEALLGDDAARAKMAAAARRLGRPAAHEKVADALESLARGERLLPQTSPAG
jgi:UDP-N-acetylglucosamine--N-acetylmuramyl-(pentapeptide) pyrophosphoryl-undecaprenol N-acetylglucosamine transferase